MLHDAFPTTTTPCGQSALWTSRPTLRTAPSLDAGNEILERIVLQRAHACGLRVFELTNAVAAALQRSSR